MRVVITRRDIALDRPDGINTSIFAFASRMVELGHEVWVVGPSVRSLVGLKKQYRYETWPEVIPLSRDLTMTRGQATRLWLTRGAAILRALRGDLAIVHGMLPVGSASLHEVLVVHDWETIGRGPSIARNVSRRVAYRRTDDVAVTCRELIPCVKAFGFDPLLLPNAISVPDEPRLPFDKRLPLVVHIGTHNYKNPLATLDAWSLAPDSDLVFIGPETPELSSAIESLPATARDRVRVSGFVPAKELDNYLRTARVVSVPSVYDVPVHSPTVLDAFANGTPVIASSISADLFKPQTNGLSIGHGTESAAEALTELLSDPQKWTCLSEGAFATACDYDRSVVVDRFLKGLREDSA
jgi:glycosyltransferase involved in cell wall biosynthesis